MHSCFDCNINAPDLWTFPSLCSQIFETRGSETIEIVGLKLENWKFWMAVQPVKVVARLNTKSSILQPVSHNIFQCHLPEKSLKTFVFFIEICNAVLWSRPQNNWSPFGDHLALAYNLNRGRKINYVIEQNHCRDSTKSNQQNALF